MPGEISLDFTEEPVSIPEEWQEKYAPVVDEVTAEVLVEEPAEPEIAAEPEIPAEPEVPAPSIEMIEPEVEVEAPAPEIEAVEPEFEAEVETEVPALGIELVDTDLPVEEPVVEKAAEPVFDETEKPLSIEDELLAMGFDLDSDKPVYPPEQDLMFSAESGGTEAAEPEEEPAMTIEELERDLFGSNVGTPEDNEATRKIEKFFTLYKKNEEFQKLLDAEYEKLQGGSDYTKMIDVISEYDKNEEQNYSTQVLGPITTAKIRENIELERKTAMMEAIKDEAVQAAKAEAAPQPASPTDVTKVMEPAPQPEAPAKEAAKVVVPAATPAKVAKEAAKAEQIEKNEAALADTEKEKGGALTVIAIIVAVLLALLLVAILVLIIAPESSVAIFINSLIGKITGLGAVTTETEWLLL
ncbi:MAG: hypothetical protein IJH91_08410 [Mogibacterium sp.]|nr:hypothetical protein [Mogibacterium sp.]